MHLFMMGAVLHTLVVAVLAFFVLFAASKADGFIKLLGTVLGWVLLAGAAAGLVFGIVGIATGQHPFGPMDRDHANWMWKWHDGGPGATPPAAQPATPPKTP